MDHHNPNHQYNYSNNYNIKPNITDINTIRYNNPQDVNMTTSYYVNPNDLSRFLFC